MKNYWDETVTNLKILGLLCTYMYICSYLAGLRTYMYTYL